MNPKIDIFIQKENFQWNCRSALIPLKEMLIPREFLIHRSFIFVPINERKVKWVDDKTDIPKCPVFVFVDLKMEHFAVRLLEEFRYQLNHEQVFAFLFFTRSF